MAGDFRVEGVGFLKLAQNPIHVTWLLKKRFRVPLATARCKKIAAIDVDCSGKAGNRIGDGVNNVEAERFGIFFAERAGAGSFKLSSWRAWNAAPEDVVFSAGVDADDCPHLMIVREKRHVGAPDYVEDGEGAGAEEGMDAGLGGLAQRFKDGGGIGDGAGGEIADMDETRILLDCGAAIVDERIQLEH